jgi:hypothetical protein
MQPGSTVLTEERFHLAGALCSRNLRLKEGSPVLRSSTAGVAQLKYQP